MSTLTAGYAQVVIKPSFAGMNTSIRKEFGNTFPTIGREAGAGFGKGMGEGLKGSTASLEQEMKSLTGKLASAQDDLNRSKKDTKTATDNEAKALGDLRVAQAKLDEVRADSKAKTSQLVAAEENLAEKQRRSEVASGKAKEARAKLDTATSNLADVEGKLKTATDKANAALGNTSDKADKAKRGLGRLHDQAKTTRDRMGGLGKYLKGGFATAIAAVSFGAITSQMKDMIDMAGDLEQSTGAVDAVFKGQSGKVHAKAEAAATDVGLDKNSFNEMSSLIGSQLKNQGTPLDQLAEKTQGLITLGSDLSSMFGGSTREAIDAISSALKGEMDPIERYGISLSQATLESEAFSKGLVKPVKDSGAISEASFKLTEAQKKYNAALKEGGKDSDKAKKAKFALTKAEQAFDKASAGKLPKIEGQNKAMAIMSALYSQSADSQGNFLKESDTYAHKVQVNDVSWKNFGASLGEMFLPAATNVTSFFTTDLLPALENMVGWVRDNAKWLGPLATGLGAAAVAAGLFAAGFALVTIAMNANPFVLIVTAIVGLVAAFVVLWNTNEGFRNFFIKTWENITSFLGTVWNSYIMPVFRAVGDFITNTLAPIFKWLYENVVKPVFEAIKTVIAIVITAVVVIIKGLIWVWEKVLAPAITWVWENILKPVFKALGDFFAWVWNEVLRPAIENLVKVWKYVLAPALANAWNNVIKPVFKALGDFFKWVWETILAPAFKAVSDAFKAVGTFFGNVWNNNIKPVFEAFGNFVNDKVAPLFEKGVEAIKKIWEGIKEVAKAPIKFVIDTVINKGIIGSFNKVAEFLNIGTLGEVKIDGFARGGWTGPGSKYQEAGVVHADEFVIRKESQRKLARNNPGLLDHMNRFGTVPGYASGGLVKPASGPYTSPFGVDRGGYTHMGQDIAVPVGTAIAAALPGVVRNAGWNAVGGRTGIGILLEHMDGRNTYYGHLSQALVKVGEQVSQGQTIGKSGNTGRSTGPHLHFELWNGGKPVDPAPYLGGAALPAGEGGGGGFNPLGALLDIGSKIKGWITEQFPAGGKFVELGLGLGTKVFNSIKDFAVEKFNAVRDWATGSGESVLEKSGVFAKMAKAALEHTGDYSEENLASMLRRMKQESGFNPKAINNWDSNAKRGTPSKGLMQVIDPTFAAYRDKGLSSDIYDPIANMVASINYTKANYGSLRAGWDRAGGYSDGGLVKSTKYDTGGWLTPGLTPVLNATGKKEAVFTSEQWRSIDTLAGVGARSMRSGGDSYYITAHEAISGQQVADALEFASRRNNRRG